MVMHNTLFVSLDIKIKLFTWNGMANNAMTISANARLAMKQLVTFCIRREVRTIQITRELPATANTEMDP